MSPCPTKYPQHELARELAPLLPPYSYTAPEEPTVWAALKAPNGQTLYLERAKDRIVVTCQRSIKPKQGAVITLSPKIKTRITVHEGTSAQNLANTIKRRLLPSYDAAWGVLLGQVAEVDGDFAAQDEIVSRFVKAGYTKNGSASCYLVSDGKEWHGTVDVSGASVALRLHSLTVDQAQRVLAALHDE